MLDKGYYAIIPANVRYDKRLTAPAKLLYGEITALCNQKGCCWARNSYFADLYGVSKRSISTWISQLIEYGYIFSEITYKNGTKEVEHRFLKLHNDPVNMDSIPGEEIFMGVGENLPAPGEEIFMGVESPAVSGTKHEEPFFSPNNTINNTSNNIKKEEPQKKPLNKYEQIIDTYTDDPKLKETILEFIKMRKLKKNPPTDNALVLIFKKLDKLSNNISGKIEILEQSIVNGYQGVFKLKQDFQQQKPPNVNDAFDELASELGMKF